MVLQELRNRPWMELIGTAWGPTPPDGDPLSGMASMYLIPYETGLLQSWVHQVHLRMAGLLAVSQDSLTDRFIVRMDTLCDVQAFYLDVFYQSERELLALLEALNLTLLDTPV